MRCPKCGYISFDHLETCLKCKKEIKSTADALPGTTHNVVTPVFLRFDRKESGENEDVERAEPIMVEEMELEDEDLEVLIAAAEEKEDKRDVTPERGGVAAREDEEEDREIDFDLSQFEESIRLEETALADSAAEIPAPELGAAPEIQLPEELVDISDLAPPTREQVPAPSAARKTEPDTAADGLIDLRLDDIDLDLRLDDLDEGVKQQRLEETTLSLDELDFTETLPKSDSPAGRSRRQEMDDELNFDLDLGGLSIDKDK